MTDTPNDQEREERQDREAAEAKAAGPEAELAYLKARCEAAQKELEALACERFPQEAKLYQLTAKAILLSGYEGALSMIADAEDGSETSVEDRRKMREEHKDLVTAIDQGMSLREYLEFDSARSWLDRQQSIDDDTDSNTGAEPD